jgi:hypothetical protein
MELSLFDNIRAPLKMSFLRKQESRTYRNCWTPAFAGVTDWQFLEIPISFVLNDLFLNSQK